MVKDLLPTIGPKPNRLQPLSWGGQDRYLYQAGCTYAQMAQCACNCKGWFGSMRLTRACWQQCGSIIYASCQRHFCVHVGVRIQRQHCPYQLPTSGAPLLATCVQYSTTARRETTLPTPTTRQHLCHLSLLACLVATAHACHICHTCHT